MSVCFMFIGLGTMILVLLILVIVAIVIFFITKHPNNKSAEISRSPETDPTVVADELEKLSRLKDKGILSQEEFNLKKKQLLGI